MKHWLQLLLLWVVIWYHYNNGRGELVNKGDGLCVEGLKEVEVPDDYKSDATTNCQVEDAWAGQGVLLTGTDSGVSFKHLKNIIDYPNFPGRLIISILHFISGVI